MLKKLLIPVLLFFPFLGLFSQTTDEQDTIKDDIVNWGIKVGVNSMSNNNYQVYYNDEEITNRTVLNQVGFSATTFFRINVSRIFMQAESSISVSKEKLNFTTPPPPSGSTVGTPYTINISYNYLDLGVFPGYNIVKEKPYLLNIYVGPSVKYYYLTKYDILYNNTYKDPSRFYTFNLTSGLSVNIARFLMDFRYEINLEDTNFKLSKPSEMPEELKPVSIKKNENTIRLSVGILF